MAIEVYPRLHVGSESDCRRGSDTLAVVHACKSPCHQRYVGYRGSLKPDHPNYLILRQGYDLVLNLIDPPQPLFKLASFVAYLEFADEIWKAGGSLLVHCNQGESRAPSLVLLFMAKRLNLLPADSFEDAARQFLPLYPRYSPGQGIRTYLSRNWTDIG